MLDECDHRSIGGRMDLFHLQEEAPGRIFWHPKGWILYRLVEDHIRDLLRLHGYQEVRTPQVIGRSIWEESGHWQNFAADMLQVDDGEREFALKPVNCPGHLQIFKRGLRSYRELPLRLAEFGVCHRNEPSGSLLGLMRVRAFVQDDGHIFCHEGQVDDEIGRFCELLRSAYAAFGFDDVAVKLSRRPPVRAGSDEVWDRAEAALAAAARAAGLDYEEQPGQGAFYGPKLEFVLKDARGRAWQCGTIQLDAVLPERFDAGYVDASGARARPIMLHRAILGSVERFVGILLEHHGGDLPLWLAPEQVVVASISDAAREYAGRVAGALRAAGLRARLDDRAEKIGRKIVDARQAGVPVLWIVGQREAERGEVSVRALVERGAQPVLPLDAAIAALKRDSRPVS
ncbi:MAG: threonine--tRNA ligase [Polyangiaceae bacterium]|nr:threonine--tRNA ligase [Polyangiaceae bacterium]